MKYIVIASVMSVLLTACFPKNEKKKPIDINDSKAVEQAYLKKNKLYHVEKPISPQRQVKKIGKNRWQVTKDTVLELHKNEGSQIDSLHYRSDSKWGLAYPKSSMETDKMSYEYLGGQKLEVREIFSSNNAFIIYESPAWTTRQYILFTREGEHKPWMSRYVNIPMIPYNGESGVEILRITDTHIYIKDNGFTFRYPLSKLKTIKDDNPFTLG